MTKEELIKNLKELTHDELNELFECVKKEAVNRSLIIGRDPRSPTEADIALAYKYRNYPAPNPPAGFDLDDHDIYWF